MKTNKSNLKIGDLVYLKDVGYPYNRTDDGGESFEGASGTVIKLNTGYSKEMVSVEFLFPILTKSGGSYMKDCLFDYERVKKENRPWLKNNLKKIFKYKKTLIDFATNIQEEINNNYD